MDYKIIDYKLINDDCLKHIENIIKKYKDEKLIIVSNPPFNINYKYNTYKDNLKEEDYLKKINYVFGKTPSVVIHYPETLHKISISLNKVPLKVISWVYNSNTGKQHRDIGFYDIKPNMKQVLQPYKNLNDKRIKERIARGCMGAKLYDWWNINQIKNVSKEKLNHPCQMPVEVMENIIGILPKNSIILDPYMGTGTTGIAVLNMNNKQNANRKFIGIEIDKDYFNLAKERIYNNIKEQ